MKYLPPLISIYLLLVAAVSNNYAKSRIRDFVSHHDGLKGKEPVIENLALDWAARLGFFNAMFAAMASVFFIGTKSAGSPWALITFLILGGIFSAMMWWIMSHDPDQLPSTVFRGARLKRLKHITFCRLVLVMVNLALLLVIWKSNV